MASTRTVANCRLISLAASVATLLTLGSAWGDEMKDQLEGISSSWPGLASSLSSVPELRDGFDHEDSRALEAISVLAKEASPTQQTLIKLLLATQNGRLTGFHYSLPRYHCASRTLFWLARAGRVPTNENLCLAAAISEGLWLLIGDARVRAALESDVIDAVDFFLHTDKLQREWGHRPLREYAPGALVALAWRGAAMASHTFDRDLRPQEFAEEIRRQPLTFSRYRRHAVTADVLRAMQTAVIQNAGGSQERMVRLAYGFYSKTHWDFVTDDRARLVHIDGLGLPVPWLRSPAFVFARRQRSGKGIGDYSDQDDARQALWKAIGVPTTCVKMVQSGRKQALGKMWGHIIPMFYCSDSGVWKGVSTAQRAYDYHWAMLVPPLSYHRYLTPSGTFPQVGFRRHGFVIISGRGARGGRNVPLTEGIPEHLLEDVLVAANLRDLGTYLARNVVERDVATRPVPSRERHSSGAVASALEQKEHTAVAGGPLHRSLKVLRVSNGEHVKAPGEQQAFRYHRAQSARHHAMVLWLEPADLSNATEIEFLIRVEGRGIEPVITLRDRGALISAPVRVAPHYLAQSADSGFTLVRIPAEAFRTKGWNLGRVRLAFIGCGNRATAGGDCTITVRDLSARFPGR